MILPVSPLLTMRETIYTGFICEHGVPGQLLWYIPGFDRGTKLASIRVYGKLCMVCMVRQRVGHTLRIVVKTINESPCVAGLAAICAHNFGSPSMKISAKICIEIYWEALVSAFAVRLAQS